MGPIQRAVRNAINPVSTRVTMLVQGGRGTRRRVARRTRASGHLVIVPDLVGLSWDEDSAMVDEQTGEAVG